MSTNTLYSHEVATVYDEVAKLFKQLLKAFYNANLPREEQIKWIDKVHRAMSRGCGEAQLLDLQNVQKEWEGKNDRF